MAAAIKAAFAAGAKRASVTLPNGMTLTADKSAASELPDELDRELTDWAKQHAR